MNSLFFTSVTHFVDVGDRYYKLIAFGRVSAVYEYYNCVQCAAITTFYILQHNVHDYFAPFARRSGMLAACVKSNNRMYVLCTSIAIEF